MNIIFLIAGLILISGVFASNIVFAQLSVDNPSDQKALRTIQLNQPLIQKKSDKGIYMIAIKSSQSPALSGLNFEIVFLNATSANLNGTPANAESNVTTDKQESAGLTVPSVIEHVIPVKSFDVRIIGNDGKELWKKTNEIPRGGRILENANLNNYTGNITISIENIVHDPAVNEIIMKQLKGASNQSETISDSVKVESQVTIS